MSTKWVEFKKYSGITENGKKFVFVIDEKEKEIEIPDENIMYICWYENQVKISDFNLI